MSNAPERFTLTLADGIATDVSLWSTGPLEWHAAVPDAGVIGGPYPSRDRAMSAAQLAAEQHYGSRVVRCEPKERVDEIAVLRARVTELETIARGVARRGIMLPCGGVTFQCGFCLGFQHEADCLWLAACKAIGNQST